MAGSSDMERKSGFLQNLDGELTSRQSPGFGLTENDCHFGLEPSAPSMG